MAIIEIKNLKKVFTTKSDKLVALQDINLSIEKGEIFGIIGLSGAGKSTLVRMMNLLEVPTEGDVYFEGNNISVLKEKDLRKVRKEIGMIFQNFNLLEQRSVLKNVLFPLEIQNTENKKAGVDRARELLELVDLQDKEKAYPSKLSGGQKQRVAIAGIIAMEPECIVLDEPTAMLDPQGREEVMNTIKQLNKELGITIVLITHFMEEAVCADRVVMMDEGKIFMTGTPKEVFSQVELLKQHRLDVPQATELIYKLKGCGYELPDGVLDEEECVQALLGLFDQNL